MTEVAKEMLELAELIKKEAIFRRGFPLISVSLSPYQCDLVEIALRESALSRNEVVGERMI